MDHETFTKLLKELDDSSSRILSTKNSAYASSYDRLHNFHAGADIAGCTSAQCCWGYLTKHLVALRDRVVNNDWLDREDLLEKCQDAINYIRFIWLIGNEEREERTEKIQVSSGDDNFYIGSPFKQTVFVTASNTEPPITKTKNEPHIGIEKY